MIDQILRVAVGSSSTPACSTGPVSILEERNASQRGGSLRGDSGFHAEHLLPGEEDDGDPHDHENELHARVSMELEEMKSVLNGVLGRIVYGRCL